MDRLYVGVMGDTTAHPGEAAVCSGERGLGVLRTDSMAVVTVKRTRATRTPQLATRTPTSASRSHRPQHGWPRFGGSRGVDDGAQHNPG